jgi:flagellar hook-associated protein 3 FlgL
MLKDIDEMVNGTVETSADLGARVNRMDLNTSRLEDQEIIAKTVMPDNFIWLLINGAARPFLGLFGVKPAGHEQEDVEAEKVIMELKSSETLHRAALSTGARIIQPTLLDFRR